MIAIALCRTHNPEDGMVVGFGAAAGEHDFRWPRTQQRSHRSACFLHRSARALAERMDRARVAVFIA